MSWALIRFLLAVLGFVPGKIGPAAEALGTADRAGQAVGVDHDFPIIHRR